MRVWLKSRSEAKPSSSGKTASIDSRAKATVVPSRGSEPPAISLAAESIDYPSDLEPFSPEESKGIEKCALVEISYVELGDMLECVQDSPFFYVKPDVALKLAETLIRQARNKKFADKR